MNKAAKQEQRIRKLLRSFNLERGSIVQVKGYFYRAVSYRYSRQPLATKGAELTGGRYNFRPQDGKSFPCLYCAEQDFTASTEKFYNLKTSNQPLPPHTVVCVEVSLAKVIDFTTEEKCQIAGLDWQEINDSWEYYQDILKIAAYSQKVGEIVRQREVAEGIMFNSTKVDGTSNLAIFMDRITAESSVKVYDPRQELIQ